MFCCCAVVGVLDDIRINFCTSLPLSPCVPKRIISLIKGKKICTSILFNFPIFLINIKLSY